MPSNDSRTDETALETTTPELDSSTSDSSAESPLPESSETNSTESSQPLDEQDNAEVEAAREAFDAETSPDTDEKLQEQGDSENDDNDDSEQAEQLIELAQPFVGQWNGLISTTNWEKGRIIAGWREALIESEAPATEYSDEAWTRRVGGVTAPHVGRLRRVYDRFVETFESYEGLYWSHFLAALDWDDAPLWLEGASKESWSVAGMREKRWQAHGAVESNRPTNSQIVEVETDEDVTLASQEEGRTKEYDDNSGVGSGPTYEGPDFGEDDELMSLAGSGPDGAAGITAENNEPRAPIVQPFAGLQELPDDLSEAVESFKLAILRHKSAGWRDVESETIEKYLNAFAVLLTQT